MAALLILLGIIVCLFIFFRVYPPFGGRTPVSAKRRSPNFVNGKFVNQIPTSMSIGLGGILSVLRDQLKDTPDRKPPSPLTPEHFDAAKVLRAEQAQITWFGHSACLLQINGKNLLLDPMFGRSPSPFPAIGPQRFSGQLPARIEDLPHVDVVVISHDHYDHMDYGSIRKLSATATMFFVPLGLAAHLRKWGVKPGQITELDWWEERTFQGLTLTCTPSRHFSGRTLTDRFATLWCSWAIAAGKTRVFFSGDTGYGPHFKQIGNKYGPFDLTLLECGQYDSHWSTIHMTPEQTVTAHTDLRGKRMIPIHWGAFVLALHSWTDPIERVLAAGKKVDATIMTPKIGEAVAFKARNYPSDAWWKKCV